MSQFPVALNFVLDSEDSRREYLSVPDVGGAAIAGINSHSYPTQYAAINAIQPTAARANAVYGFYQDTFWNPLKVGGIADQDIANRVLDQSVNGGPHTGPTLLQRAANACGASLDTDGVIGPATLETVNAIDPERLLAAYRAARVARYEMIASDNPELTKYLPQWIARAQK